MTCHKIITLERLKEPTADHSCVLGKKYVEHLLGARLHVRAFMFLKIAPFRGLLSTRHCCRHVLHGRQWTKSSPLSGVAENNSQTLPLSSHTPTVGMCMWHGAVDKIRYCPIAVWWRGESPRM